MDKNLNAVRRAFGLLFVTIAIAVAVAAMLSELILLYNGSMVYYAAVWFSSICVAIGLLFYRSPSVVHNLRQRFREGTGLPKIMKAINGLSWATPFALIPVFPAYYPYLVLLGIGLGNVSTYIIFRHMHGFVFREQFIVGVVSLSALPLLVAIKSLNAVSDDVLLLLLRLSIALAYGIGGTYALQFE